MATPPLIYGIPFHRVEITPDHKPATQAQQLAVLKQNTIDLIVLARYMQVLSVAFCERYPRRIIKVHHSFLPAFTGVKLIGSTAHSVTASSTMASSSPECKEHLARRSPSRSHLERSLSGAARAVQRRPLAPRTPHPVLCKQDCRLQGAHLKTNATRIVSVWHVYRCRA